MNETPSADVIEEQTDELNAALTDEQVRDTLPGRWTHDESDIDLDVDTAREIIHEWMTMGHDTSAVIDTVRDTDDGVTYHYALISLQTDTDRPVMVMGHTFVSELSWPMMDMETMDNVDETNSREIKAFAEFLTAAVEAAGWSRECCADVDAGCPHTWQILYPMDYERNVESVQRMLDAQ